MCEWTVGEGKERGTQALGKIVVLNAKAGRVFEYYLTPISYFYSGCKWGPEKEQELSMVSPGLVREKQRVDLFSLSCQIRLFFY